MDDNKILGKMEDNEKDATMAVKFMALIKRLKEHYSVNEDEQRLDSIMEMQQSGFINIGSIQLREKQLSQSLIILFSSICFPKLTTISISSSSEDKLDFSITLLNSYPFKHQIQSLYINFKTINIGDIKSIFQHPWPSLHTLTIKTLLQAQQVRSLFEESSKFGNLQQLIIKLRKGQYVCENMINFFIEREQFPWPRLQKLHFPFNYLNGSQMKALQTLSKFVPAIKQIDLKNNQINNFGASLLASSHFPALTHLNLQNNCLANQGVNNLLNANWPKLTHLYLGSNKLQDQAMQYLSRAQWPHLILLDLNINYIGVQGCKSLIKGKWENLQSLNLQRNIIDDRCMEVLIQSHWPHLKQISFKQNIIDDFAMQQLRNANWENLKALNLMQKTHGIKIGADGIYYLLQKTDDQQCLERKGDFIYQQLSPINPNLFKQLRELNLSMNMIGNLGVYWLTRMNWQKLQTLNLTQNGLTDQCIKYFCHSYWPNLIKFDLNKNDFTDKAMAMLQHKSYWKKLQVLFLNSHKIYFQGFLYLAKESFPQLKKGTFDGCVNNLKDWQKKLIINNFCGKKRRKMVEIE